MWGGDRGVVENHCVLLHFYNGNEKLYSWVIKFSQENFETELMSKKAKYTPIVHAHC